MSYCFFFCFFLKKLPVTTASKTTKQSLKLILTTRDAKFLTQAKFWEKCHSLGQPNSSHKLGFGTFCSYNELTASKTSKESVGADPNKSYLLMYIQFHWKQTQIYCNADLQIDIMITPNIKEKFFSPESNFL